MNPNYSMIPSYSMIPNYLMINWKYMDFDNPKVYVDTSITDDGLVIKEVLTTWEFQKY